MENTNAKTMNELFIHKLETEHEKLANETSAYIRSRLREVGFTRKILTPMYVTKADLQRSLNNDQLTKIVDIEPDSAAMQIALRSQPDVRYINGDRFEVSFFNVSSEEFQKVEEELLAYEMPITEVIERNSVKDIQKVEDQAFITAIEAAIESSGKTVSYTNATAGTIDLQAFVKLFNKLEESDVASNPNQLKTDLILMNQADYNKFSILPATTIGSGVAGEMFVGGYKYETILGRKLVVTNKGDLVPQGTIYAFAPEQFLGKFFVLNDTKFWVEKKRNLIKWSCYETIGMGIGNVKGCAKLTLSN